MAYTTIDLPTDYFNTVTWTGDGSSSRNITGVGFQPDWVWVKCRNAAVSHAVYDSVRGASNLINTNTTSAEGTNAAVNAFISDGFTVNSDSYVNLSSNTYVGWNWLASNTTASNTDGSITSTVSANTTAGFSIATYTGTGSGATVGHGLGTTPAWVLVKERGASGESWNNFHQSLGEGKTIMLNLTNAEQSSSTMWNNTAPTSSVFSVGADAGSNGSSKTYVAYCFAEKKGYSKFGSYTGNGSTDGTFVYTGFKPAWVMTKRTSSSATGWVLMDNKRETFNDGATNYLIANTSVAETDSSFAVDFLSNGFKPRTNSGGTNTSGATYIFMAFAEAPFVSSGGIPTTAR